MSRLNDLLNLGQSIWIDSIRRSFITSGEFQAQIDLGLRGVTSNPSIFEKAIAGSSDYDDDMRRLTRLGKSVNSIYEALALEDIRRAADLLRRVYDASGGLDGYVSLEVSPLLANDAHATVEEARRLFAALGRPNVMIKVPATARGIPAIQTLISEGVNVNVTLIFSLEHYEAAAEAYISGLEKRLEHNGNLERVASVASFFISRIDSAVDPEVAKVGRPDLAGKVAIANAKVGYARFRELFSGERWEKLAAKGARVQRPLWGSTSAKNPLYSDVLYVDKLIGPDTVNTLPPATLQAFLDHGKAEQTISSNLNEARKALSDLAELGIDLNEVNQKLQNDGVAAFIKSFETLMAAIAEKRERLNEESRTVALSLGHLDQPVEKALDEIADSQTMERIWAHDYAVWKPAPDEISNRLGWLNSPEMMRENIGSLKPLSGELAAQGFTHAVLLGMGGSSLAPEVMHKVLGASSRSLDFSILDSTDPGAVLSLAGKLPLAKTLFIVSSKSGGTIETLSFFKYFYNLVSDEVGPEQAGSHFVAITDQGSKLHAVASEKDFRAVYLNDPNVGGRYSALTYFGLAPAALMGVDLELLLERALVAADNCESCNSPVLGDNNGALLGVVLAEAAKAGRDKLTLILSPAIESFGDWIEQLIAESTGKEGTGILPVVGEPLASPEAYGDDRLFVYISIKGDLTYEAGVKALEDAGCPTVRLKLNDPYDLGAHFFLWEMAVAVAGARMSINPFDQPDVESAKIRAREMVDAYARNGRLPQMEPALEAEGVSIFGDARGDSTGQAFLQFLGAAGQGAYAAVQAYVAQSPEVDELLLKLRTKIRARFKIAATTGYGPRFLHSTGQLHKGDAGKGLFIQFTADDSSDAGIPDEPGSPTCSMTFGALKMAQALGDASALSEKGRKVIRFHFAGDFPNSLRRLLDETF